MPGAWPLVGREDELAFLARALGATGAASGVVLAGDAGVGKTRLAREFVEEAAGRGAATIWVTATTSAQPLPLGAFSQFLPDDAPSEALSALNLTRRALIDSASGARLIVGIDDAHLLDESSAVLVHQIVSSQSAFVVATLRNGERVPGAISSLMKGGVVERVEVQPLSRAELDQLLTAALGDQVDGAVLHAVWESSRGNALFAREMVLAAIEDHVLIHGGGVWHAVSPLAAASRLRQIVEERLDRLTPAERDVLEVLAAGQPLGASLLGAVTEREAVHSVEERGLLAVETNGSRVVVRLAHPIYGEVLRAHRRPLRARAIAQRLAGALKSTNVRRRDDVLRLATWKLDAGEAIDPPTAVTASYRARAAGDYRLTERLARAAVDAGGGFAAHFVLAEALYGQQRFEETEELLAPIGGEATTDLERERWAAQRAVNLHLGLLRPVEAAAVLAEAEAHLTDDALRAELAGERSAIQLFAGRIDEALATATAVLERADVHERARLIAFRPAVTAFALTGHTDKAIATAEQAMPLAIRYREEVPNASVEIAAGVGMAHMLAGRLDQAEALAGSLYELALTQDDHAFRGLTAAARARIRLMMGDLQGAVTYGREARALMRTGGGVGGFLIWGLAVLAQAEACRGNVAAATQAAEEAQEALGDAIHLFDVEVDLARAWIAGARGEITEACEHVRRAVGPTAGRGQLAAEAIALHDLVRLGDASGVVERLRTLAGASDSPLFAAFADHAAALAEGDAAGLEAVAARFAAMGAELLAGEAYAHASASFRASGRMGEARRAGERSERAAATCGGAATPALQVAERPLPLTRREREVATMAARGLTSPGIAERLVISVRTVESHLDKAYAKLGIGGRAELADVLGVAPTDANNP